MRRIGCDAGLAPKAEMNVIPFLDVLLVLLLILMVTTPVIQQTVQVELPPARDAKINRTAASTQPIILEISAPGCYALIIRGKRLENLPHQQVIIQSRQQMQQNAQSQFLIAGSAAVPYQEILKGLGLLHQAGITAVGLMTQPL
ncbi:MAG: biopolymer transporter ExbD [Candidatus Symbiodolus clandestinus]